MKIEIESHISEDAQAASANTARMYERGIQLVRENKALLFGIASLAASLIYLLLGTCTTSLAQLLWQIPDLQPRPWIGMLAVFTALFALASVGFGVAATVGFARSDKTTSKAVGLSLSLLALAVCILSTVLLLLV